MKKIPTFIAPVAVALTLTATVFNIVVFASEDDRVAGAAIGAWVLMTGGTGALITLRKRGHAVGWLLVGIAVIATSHGLVQTYAVTGLERGASLPGEMVAAWLSTWLGLPAIALFILLILVFPTGTLLSPRWRVVALATVAAVAGGAITSALLPGPLPAIPAVRNPLGVEGAGGMLSALSELLMVVPVGALLAATASQVLRLRRARGPERQQIKFVAYAIVMVPVLVAISQLVIPQGTSDEQWLEFVINIAAGMLIPLAIGAAILRHRLYEIDVIINRTLVYGSLTAILAAVYVGLVFVLQAIFATFASQSDLAVAASTLVVAGLFRPLRRRVQDFIDRRFYRRKFDTQQTLDEFGEHVRDEVDLGSLTLRLQHVVSDTMQPTHVSLWLRQAQQ